MPVSQHLSPFEREFQVVRIGAIANFAVEGLVAQCRSRELKLESSKMHGRVTRTHPIHLFRHLL